MYPPTLLSACAGTHQPEKAGVVPLTVTAQFLTSVADAKDVSDINIAAGIALEELEAQLATAAATSAPTDNGRTRDGWLARLLR